MKNIGSVNSKHDYAVVPGRFTFQIGGSDGVTVLVTASDRKPAAVIMVICFPDQPVTQVGIPDIGGQGYLAVPVAVPQLVSVCKLDISAARKLDLFKGFGVIEHSEEIVGYFAGVIFLKLEVFVFVFFL